MAEDLPAVEGAVCSKAQRVDETGHWRQGELIDEHEGNPQVGLEVLGRGIVRGFEMALGFHGTARAMQDENDPTLSHYPSTTQAWCQHGRWWRCGLPAMAGLNCGSASSTHIVNYYGGAQENNDCR
ncbi:hypothetical protein [Pseudomonas alkylphenolica]|uniref:hypothetical protein n=1 Tax=Pseudomonas alkylphenolica TaxID=237609 RepID=UPI00056FA878|nr:hypothetical protein [Pseudomonas alkylphenolica]